MDGGSESRPGSVEPVGEFAEGAFRFQPGAEVLREVASGLVEGWGLVSVWPGLGGP